MGIVRSAGLIGTLVLTFAGSAARADAVAPPLWADIDLGTCPLRSPLRVADGSSVAAYLSLRHCGSRIAAPAVAGPQVEVVRIIGVRGDPAPAAGPRPGTRPERRSRSGAISSAAGGLPAPIADAVAASARSHRIDPLLLSAMIGAESDGSAAAVSSAGARGLLQILPATGLQWGVDPEALFDPAINIETGARHLRHLQRRYGNNPELVLAAYNAGEGSVDAHGGVPPFSETRTYVDRVLSRYALFRARAGF